MTSNDIRIMINGQQFVIDGQRLTPAPENTFQQEVMKRFDGLDSRMDKMESRLDGVESRLGKVESDVQELHTEIRAVQDEQRLMRQSIDSLQTSVYWVLGAIGIFLAALGVFIPVYFSLKDPSKNKPESSPTVITIPQPQADINAIVKQLSEMFDLKPKH